MRNSVPSVLALIAAVVVTQIGESRAQEYPTKPIRFLVGNAPGGGTDIVARLTAQRMSETLGRPVIVDNRPGATGVVASMLVAKAPPDGYSIQIVSRSSHAIAPALQSDLPYHPVRDFAAVSLLVTSPNMLLVHPSVPSNTVKELVTYAKARPGTLAYGSSGVGSVGHMAAELFQVVTDTRFTHVPYKGAAPSVNDLLSGRIQLMFIGPTLVPHVKSKKLKALAMGGSKRLASLDEVPTFAEAGYPDVDAAQWYGVVTTAGTPKAAIDRLNREIVSAIQRAEVRDKLLEIGFDPTTCTPQEFARIIRDDLARWQKVVKTAGIRPE